MSNDIKKPKSEARRTQLENNIITAFERVHFEQDINFEYDGEFSKLGDAWRELRHYYLEYDDALISVKLMSEYMIAIEALYSWGYQAEAGSDRRQSLFRALSSLQHMWQRVEEAIIDYEND